MKKTQNMKKYFISKNYNKIFTLKKGNIIINELYKKVINRKMRLFFINQYLFLFQSLFYIKLQ